MRTAIYARYSGDRQREASIEDQVRNCTKFAERENLTILFSYYDKAKTGSVSARPSYQTMIEAAKGKKFEVLIVDDLSRLARDDYEMKGLLRKLSLLQIRVIAVSDGYDSFKKGHKIHAGFKGLMNELYLDDLRDKTHRGMTGQALKGFNCGGRTYGYKNIPIEDTSKKDPYGRPFVIAVKYEIDPEQASIVRDIHKWYAAGYSYQWIARQLNKAKISSSRGDSWATSAIKVILENEMYEGNLIWNRRQWSKNPETGKRVAHKRPKSEWIVTNNQNLRIVDQEIISSVREKQRINQKSYTKYNIRPSSQRYLFSGILACANCGGNFTIVGQNRYGCATHKTKGSSVCNNSMSVSRSIVEENLLTGIKNNLMSVSNVEKFKKDAGKIIENYRHNDHVSVLQNRLKDITKELDNIMSAIRAGIITPTTKAALEDAEGRLEKINSDIGHAMAINPASILPRAIDRYQKAVESLGIEFGDRTAQARGIIKSIVGDKILVHRRNGYLEAELQNNMVSMLAKAVGSDLYGCGGRICNESEYIPLINVNK